ncbi:hypothetical protein GYMLUDRAFT_249441 [Collybiopsis luxurians FD-317 M1]|uniref:Fork-head domain-containing protein n=1 Tax=Collybiopsis luxurians FD-317 M1 TaxID=944289 RepID=A0A0D0BXL0_9AGAR|nr:hypothetical protein GYMLUDRAFT_249441 [Collybiopsis luxurians FD-317 M1]
MAQLKLHCLPAAKKKLHIRSPFNAPGQDAAKFIPPWGILTLTSRRTDMAILFRRSADAKQRSQGCLSAPGQAVIKPIAPREISTFTFSANNMVYQGALKRSDSREVALNLPRFVSRNSTRARLSLLNWNGVTDMDISGNLASKVFSFTSESRSSEITYSTNWSIIAAGATVEGHITSFRLFAVAQFGFYALVLFTSIPSLPRQLNRQNRLLHGNPFWPPPRGRSLPGIFPVDETIWVFPSSNVIINISGKPLYSSLFEYQYFLLALFSRTAMPDGFIPAHAYDPGQVLSTIEMENTDVFLASAFFSRSSCLPSNKVQVASAIPLELRPARVSIIRAQSWDEINLDKCSENIEIIRWMNNFPPGTPVNLDSVPDLMPGKRPSATLATLTQLSIVGSPNQRLSLKEIYHAIEQHFEFFRNCLDKRWQRSIRRLLSSRVEFMKVVQPGLGNFWTLDMSSLTWDRFKPESHLTEANLEILRRINNFPADVAVNLNTLNDPLPGQGPSVTLATLVQLAIAGSPNHMLSLREICHAIEERFEFYKRSPNKKWQASIRHLLSLQGVFKQVTRFGQGNFWTMDMSAKGYKRQIKRKRHLAQNS